jgi:thiol:disulfide interchange protein DsbC
MGPAPHPSDGRNILRTILASVVSLLLILASGAGQAGALTDNASGRERCGPVTPELAAKSLGNMVDNVVGVVPGPLPDIWEVDARKGGKVYPIYMDCTLQYVFHGQFIRLSDMQDVTSLRYMDLNRVDVSSIPLKDAIVLGKKGSARRIIVLTDPTCPYCIKLHAELKKAIAKDAEVAFYVMPYPRNMTDKATYQKCLELVCSKSAKLLDDAYSGKQLPPPSCKSDAVFETMQLAQRIGVQGTPSMILPDGRLVSGFRDADTLLALLK